MPCRRAKAGCSNQSMYDGFRSLAFRDGERGTHYENGVRKFVRVNFEAHYVGQLLRGLSWVPGERHCGGPAISLLRHFRDTVRAEHLTRADNKQAIL